MVKEIHLPDTENFRLNVVSKNTTLAHMQENNAVL